MLGKRGQDDQLWDRTGRWARMQGDGQGADVGEKDRITSYGVNDGGQGMMCTLGERGKTTSYGGGYWGTGVTVMDQPRA